MENTEYVVVFNRNGPIPLRHIVTLRAPYDEDEFKKWYYSEYRELEGDEFVYCATRKEMERTVEKVRDSEKQEEKL